MRRADRAVAPVGREQNSSGRRSHWRDSHDFDRTRCRAQNPLRDASQKETPDGAMTVRSDQDQVRTTPWQAGEVGSGMFRAGFGKRLVAGAADSLGPFLDEAFAFARGVFDEGGKSFEALQVHDVQNAKRGPCGP